MSIKLRKAILLDIPQMLELAIGNIAAGGMYFPYLL